MLEIHDKEFSRFLYLCDMKSENKKKLLLAFANSLILLALVYIGDRMDFAFGAEGLVMKKVDLVRKLVGLEDKYETDDILAVNIGYDRDFVDAFNEYGFPVGRRAIVARGSLLALLDSLRGADYRSLFIDVQFFKTDVTEYDSVLVAALNATPRLVLPDMGANDMIPGIDYSLFAKSTYGITMNDANFVKYVFSSGGKPSVARKIMEIEKGPEWRSGSRALFLRLPYTIGSGYDDNLNKTLFHLGTDILGVYTSSQLARLVDGKTVIVGDFVGGDQHDTYVGSLSGPEITANAILALRRGDDKVSAWVAIVMFAVYFCISIWVMVDVSRRLPKRIARSRLLAFAMSFVGFSTVILSMTVIIYLITGVFHELYLNTLWLSLFYLVYRKYHIK